MTTALISPRDLFQAGTILLMTPLALFVPRDRWPQSCRRLARLLEGIRIGQVADIAHALSGFEAQRGEHGGYRQVLESYFENRLQVVDQNLLDRWQPDIGLTGHEHIDDALTAGNGAILWVTPFAFSDLIVKIGLAQGGYAIDHLSRLEHGFSTTKIGMATLNRLRTRIEDRYLHDRVLIDTTTEKKATLALRRIVKNNGIVSITVGSQTKTPHRISVGHGELEIAAGAVRLAQMTKAPLIPVFGVKRGDLDFHVYMEPPLDVVAEETQPALQQYAALLYQYIQKYPYQWRGTVNFTT